MSIPPPLRRFLVIPFFVLVPLVFLAAQTPDQKPPAAKADPPRKPPREEEEETAVRPKRTRPLRVEDDDPTPPKPGSAVTTPAAVDLAAEAERARNPIVRELYKSLAVPHDRIRFVSPPREDSIEPLRRFVVLKPGRTTSVTYRRLNDRAELTVGLGKDHGITYYEQHAVNLVTEFLKEELEKEPPSSRKHLSRANMLREAERVLASVVRYHESARERGVREGNDWEDLENRLRAALRGVQLRQLHFLADARDWEKAVVLGAHLAKTYPEAKDVREGFTQVLVRQAEEAFKANNYRAARSHLERLLDYYPNSPAAEKLQARLQKRSADLLGDAEELMKKGNKQEAAERLKEAETIWPHLTQLTSYRLKFGGALSTVHVGVRSVPEFLSPATAGSDVEKQALDLLFEGLVKYRANAPGGPRYEPVLAADMPRLTPLGREFQLQRQAYWSNGERVSAPDVRSTIQLLTAGRTPNEGPSWLKLLDRQNGVSISGDAFQVKLTLGQGYLDPLSLMTFKVLPPLGESKRADDRDFAKKPVGSGPFVLQSLTAGEAVFVANSYYGARPEKRGQPRVNEIRFYQPEDPAGDFLNGRLHLLLDPPTALYQKLQTAGPGVLKFQTLRNRRVWFLAVNHRKPALQDARLRRALALAINREQVLKECFRAGADDVHRPLNGPYPPDSWAYNPELKQGDPHNPTFAQAFASKALAGRPDGMKLKLSYPAGDEAVRKACELMKKQVQALEAGLDLDLVERAPADLRRDVEEGHQYDLAYYCWDYPDHTFWLWPLFDPASGRNFLGYQNEAELGRLFRQLLGHRDFEEVRKLTHEIHKHVFDEVPFVPLWQLDTHLVSHPRLELPANLDAQAVFSDADAWKLEPR